MTSPAAHGRDSIFALPRKDDANIQVTLDFVASLEGLGNATRDAQYNLSETAQAATKSKVATW
jgi:hypothetical protein